jgi:enediyne biosynthesis protein E5
MITDPKTTTRYKWSQCLVAGLVAVAEMCFRLAPTWFGRAPEFLSFDAAYLALFVVGPAANLIEIWWNAGKARPTTTGAMKSQL